MVSARARAKPRAPNRKFTICADICRHVRETNLWQIGQSCVRSPRDRYRGWFAHADSILCLPVGKRLCFRVWLRNGRIGSRPSAACRNRGLGQVRSGGDIRPDRLDCSRAMRRQIRKAYQARTARAASLDCRASRAASTQRCERCHRHVALGRYSAPHGAGGASTGWLRSNSTRKKRSSGAPAAFVRLS